MRKKGRIWIVCDDRGWVWVCEGVGGVVGVLCWGRGRGEEWESDGIDGMKGKKEGKGCGL